MGKKSLISSQVAPAIGPYSQAIKIGPLVFVSGQIGLITGQDTQVRGNVVDQTQQVLLNIKNILSEAGLELGHIVKTTVYLVDMGEFKAMNEAYAIYFKESPPARSTVQVAGLPRGARVLIEAIAYLE